MVTAANTRSLLTVQEAASRLRLHPMTVRKMIADGRIPAVQLGGCGTALRIDERELEQWLLRNHLLTKETN